LSTLSELVGAEAEVRQDLLVAAQLEQAEAVVGLVNTVLQELILLLVCNMTLQ
jgi:hypothetical protein